MTNKMMIWITFQREGIHCYPAAATDPKLATGGWLDVSFLASPHRHIFHFRIEMEVFHDDRDVEFIQAKRMIEKLYDTGTLQLNYKSCEMLAKDLYEQLKAMFGARDYVIEVSEDGENGCRATFYRANEELPKLAPEQKYPGNISWGTNQTQPIYQGGGSAGQPQNPTGWDKTVRLPPRNEQEREFLAKMHRDTPTDASGLDKVVNAKTREQIINSMCMTYRHDFGLILSEQEKKDYPLNSGMTKAEQAALWNDMRKIFDNDIAPYMEFKYE